MPDISWDVVTTGEALGVFTPEHGGALRPGGTAHFTVGGAELNVAVGLSRLGHRSAWAGRIGDDAVGRAVLSVLRSEGVEHRAVRVDPAAATGLYVKESLGLGRTQVSYHRAGSAATRMTAADADLEHLLSGRILHLTGITPALSSTTEDLVRELLGQALARGVQISFDANVRHRLLADRAPAQLLAPFLESADLLFLSGQECAELLGARTPDEAAARFADLRASVVVVHDASGAYAVDPTGVTTVAARALHVIDPVGAGDAFVSGYLSGHLRGWPVQDCLRMAEVCAAHVVTVAGDHEGVPTEREALAELGMSTAQAER
jgi:2-dehydro-3-deoxygluconokinase